MLYDQFIEDGHTIELISIRVVTEDGANTTQYHEFDPERAGGWVRTMCCPAAVRRLAWRSPLVVLTWKNSSRIDGTDSIELWAWVRGYDHVAPVSIVGPMTLPPTVPVSPGTAAVIGRTGDAPGCRRGHAASTARWSMPRCCAGFVSITSTDDAGLARPR